MTSRAALRVLANISLIKRDDFEDLALPVFWATLTSAVRGSGRTANMELDASAAATSAADSHMSATQSAADAAALSASSSADAVRAAAFSVINSARSAGQSPTKISAATTSSSPLITARSAANSAANFATSADALAVEEKTELAGVWGLIQVPEAIQTNRIAFLDRLKADARWDFFRRWYEEMWDGTWTDWELAHEVAKIDASVWEDGLDAVAAEIEKVKSALFSKRIAVESAVKRVESALNDVLASADSQGLGVTDIESRILLRLFRKYRKDVRRLFFDFAEVLRNIQNNILLGQYPDDAAHNLLARSLEIGVHEISNLEPDLRMEAERLYPKSAEAKQFEREPIDAKLKVASLATELKHGIGGIIEDRHGIGGNFPPEHLEETAELTAQTTIIWEGADILEKEANAEIPDRDNVAKAIEYLKRGLAPCLKWIGRKGDLATDTIIKWGVPAAGAYLVANSDKIQSLLNAAQEWLPLLR